ncbi:MAG TPA: universal stress protein [Streptosporangiaceae bacterium]|nr:universal stress protein [Streptosporangiaceae bacterium]
MTTASGAPVVVVGVDSSAASVLALRWAARYAADTGARVLAVMCWHYPGAFGVSPIGRAPEPVTDEVRQHLSETLEQAIADGAPNAEVERQLEYGHPAQCLVDLSQQADLLVVGNRGHSSVTGMLAGSVSLHCVTHAACPVVVVRSGE